VTSGIQDIPEIRGLGRRQNLIRIPQECDVPITRRVRQLIDTAEFRRLARISQLGLVSLVYPAAHHSRFEHSLGVYRLALLYLQQLSHDERFCETVQKKDAERFLAAALLHDLGHWPFCHPIEDINLPGVPQHELFANSFLLESEIAQTLRDAWGIAPREIVSLLSEKPRDMKSRLLSSMLSGPIDVDKMDYLMRDSLHAGVPYGRNFDQQRLIGSLCVNESGDGLAITEKGRTAAEMMVFARYVMFSEVYWHHAVRCATAMLQRAFYLLHVNLDLDTLFRLSEHELIASVRKAAEKNPAADLLDGLFGPERRLYKRFAQYSAFQLPDQYHRLSRRPYAFLVTCAEHLAAVLQRELGIEVRPHEVLFDAPPVKLEVQFNVEIHFPKEGCYRQLGDVSPVVRTLAREQFDDYVKRVRVFIHPRLLRTVDSLEDRDTLIREAVSLAGG
jgi:HD superfamily phosphohydrolase